MLVENTVSTNVAGLGTFYDITSGDERTRITHSVGAFSGATSGGLHALRKLSWVVNVEVDNGEH